MIDINLPNSQAHGSFHFVSVLYHPSFSMPWTKSNPLVIHQVFLPWSESFCTMAFSRLISILSFFSLAIFAYGAPSSSSSSSSSSLSARTNKVQFEVTLTWEDYSPNGGKARKMILTNGTFPGPALKMKVGDEVDFLVHNDLPESTAVHFHGIVQSGTPWSDGVPGLSQKPIPSGCSYLYKWTADASGVYFYHAHSRSQLMDGLYGAIIIEPPSDAPKPFSLISNNTATVAAMEAAEKIQQTVFVSDYNKYTSKEFHEQEESANVDIACADSILLNGKGSQYCLSRDELTAYTSPKVTGILANISPPELTDKGCLPPNTVTQGNFTFALDTLPSDVFFECTPSSGEIATFDVDPAKGWAAFTFINPGGYEILKFTIDGHKMWVYAVDGGYITPQLVDQVIINNGDRYSFLVQLNQAPAQYSIRVTNQGLNQVISGFGVLDYKGSHGPARTDPNALAKMNYAGVNLTQLVLFNDNKAAPYPPSSPAKTVDITYQLNIKKLKQPYEWTLSGVDSFKGFMEDDYPLLYQNPATIPQDDLIIRTLKGQWVDLVVKTQGPLSQPHPMHKHSNKAYLLGKGTGVWNWTTVAEAAAVLPPATFNFVNPPLRDGVSRPALAFLAHENTDVNAIVHNHSGRNQQHMDGPAL